MPAGIGYGLDARRKRGGFNRKPRAPLTGPIAEQKEAHDARMENMGSFMSSSKRRKPKRGKA